MGNSSAEGNKQNNFKNFNIQKYLNQGLSRQQILQIREAFETYDPVNDQINVQRLKSCTVQSSHKQEITKMLGNKQNINFDQFFALSKQLVNEQLKKHPGMQIDGTQIQATCFFCPYAVDKKH